MPVFLLAGTAIGGLSFTALRLVRDVVKDKRIAFGVKGSQKSNSKANVPDEANAFDDESDTSLERRLLRSEYRDSAIVDPAWSQGAEIAAVEEDTEVSSEPDFELWVETELQADWCLEAATPQGMPQPEVSTESAPGAGEWRGSCRTSSIRRRWDDFEALMQQGKRTSYTYSSKASQFDSEVGRVLSPKQASACQRVLGLSEGSTEDQVRAAFRRLCLASHPDKGGSNAKFEAVLDAYRALTASPSLPARAVLSGRAEDKSRSPKVDRTDKTRIVINLVDGTPTACAIDMLLSGLVFMSMLPFP